MKPQFKSLKNSIIGVLFVTLCVMSVNLHAQSDSLLQNSDLKRHNFRLAIEGRPMMILEKCQLQTMLSEEQFRSYKVARNCYIASIPLLSYGAYCMLGSAVSSFSFVDRTLDFADSFGLFYILSYFRHNINDL